MAKIYEVGLKLSAAVDPKLRGAFASAQESMRALGNGMKAMQDRLGNMDAWRKLNVGVKDTKQQFGLAKQEMERLRAQMSATDKPTKAMAHAFESAKSRVFELGDRLRSQRAELADVAAAMDKAGISTKNFGAEQQRLLEQMAKMGTLRERIAANNAAIQANDARKAALKQKMLGPLAGIISPGMIGAAGVFKTMKTAASYEHELNKATAIGSLTPEERERQDKLYRELGMSTEFTTAQAAAAGVNLSRAGFKTNEIEAGLPAILNMATASDMSIDETASILADSLRGYNFKAGDMGKVADIMAKSANVANMDLRLMAETFKYAVPYANKLGVSMEELGAMTGIMADNGIKGSMAGTALREGLTRLAAPPKEAATALKKLKIQTVDADGNLLSMTTILKQLNKAMKGMGNAEQVEYMNAIFGKRGGTGMLSVISAYDDGKLQKKLKEILDSEGYSVKAAEIMRQGLTGSWAKLTSAIEGVSLSFVTKDFSGGITGQIDDIAKKLTDLAKWLQAHPEFVTFATKFAKNFVLAKMAIFGAMYAFAQLKGVYLGVKGAVLAGHAAMLLYKGGMTALTAAYGANSAVVKAATAAQWLWNAALNANPIGLAVTGIAALAAGAVLLYNKWEPFRKWWDETWALIKEKASGTADWFRELPDKIKGWLAAIPDHFVEMIKSLPAKIGEAFEEFGRYIKGKLKEFFTLNFNFGDVGKKVGAGVSAWQKGAADPSGQFDMNVPGSAAGRKTAGPMLSLIGEGAAPEYVIPTESRYRERALALWQQAGKDLGVPMYAKGERIDKKQPNTGVFAWDPMITPESFGERIFSDKPIWKSIREFISSLTALDFWDAHDFYSQFKGPASLLAPYLSAQYKFMGAQNMDKWSQLFAVGGTTLTLFLSNMIANASSSLKGKSNKSNVFDEWGLKLKKLFAFNVLFGKDIKDVDMNVPGSAAGRKTAGPMLSLIGEGTAPEYVIPTESRYRERALALWQQAGKDLGVPMYESGVGGRSFVEERNVLGLSLLEWNDMLSTAQNAYLPMTVLAGMLLAPLKLGKLMPLATMLTGAAGSLGLGRIGVSLSRYLGRATDESLVKKIENTNQRTKQITNNVTINATVTGVEKAEDFVKELQKYGLTFGEYSDTISIGDESRLAFSD